MLGVAFRDIDVRPLPALALINGGLNHPADDLAAAFQADADHLLRNGDGQVPQIIHVLVHLAVQGRSGPFQEFVKVRSQLFGLPLLGTLALLKGLGGPLGQSLRPSGLQAALAGGLEQLLCLQFRLQPGLVQNGLGPPVGVCDDLLRLDLGKAYRVRLGFGFRLRLGNLLFRPDIQLRRVLPAVLPGRGRGRLGPGGCFLFQDQLFRLGEVIGLGLGTHNGFPNTRQ